MLSNAFSERFVLTSRTEVTDRMLIAGRWHLHAVLDDYAVHYNQHRPHRARNLGRRALAGSPQARALARPGQYDAAGYSAS